MTTRRYLRRVLIDLIVFTFWLAAFSSAVHILVLFVTAAVTCEPTWFGPFKITWVC